jgi:hypothetical protein
VSTIRLGKKMLKPAEYETQRAKGIGSAAASFRLGARILKPKPRAPAPVVAAAPVVPPVEEPEVEVATKAPAKKRGGRRKKAVAADIDSTPHD